MKTVQRTKANKNRKPNTKSLAVRSYGSNHQNTTAHERAKEISSGVPAERVKRALKTGARTTEGSTDTVSLYIRIHVYIDIYEQIQRIRLS